ncbi:MAG: SET domain-containing protein, partial [Desulfuromonadales bacterium]|nr:SET domain-containing protein [Desulfuromonadales bacterium]
MIHPDAVLTSISPAVGLGLVAIRPLPKGTLIWVHDALDRILTPQAMASLPSQFAALKARFTYRNQNGYYVLAWEDARFMNHSCDSNCALTPFN